MARTPGLRGLLPKLSYADRLPLGYLHQYAPNPLPPPVYPTTCFQVLRIRTA
jgi:hypothetical protein